MESENDNLSSGISLQEYLQILRRRRFVILQAFLLITIVGIFVTLLTKPVYEATGQLLVQTPGLNVNTVDTSNPLSALSAVNQPKSPETTMQVLQTPDLQNLVEQDIGQRIVFTFDIPKDTSVIEASAEASNPKDAVKAVNSLFQAYQDRDKASSIIGLENELVAVKQQVAKYTRAQKVASDNLRDFQQKHNLPEFNQDRSQKMQRVASLNSDYEGQKIGLAVLQSKIAMDSETLAHEHQTTPYTLPSTNPRVQELKTQIQALRVQRQAMTQQGGFNPTGNAPALKALDAEVKALKADLAKQPALFPNKVTNVNGFYESVRNRIADEQASVAPLQTQMADTKSALATAQAAAAQLPNLAQQLDQLTTARLGAVGNLDNYAKQESDLTLRLQARQPTTQVIQTALADPTPVRPKKLLNIIFSCVIGLFVGLCLALLQEFLDDRINTVEDSDRLLGLPSLGYVPSLSGADAHLLPQMKDSRGAAESYRVLRTNINFASVDTPLRTLLVTSSTPGEGKTTTAINLAFAMVMDGKKVILLDTDLRRPTIHHLLGLGDIPGLTDVLGGQAQISDVLMQHNSVKGLMAMTAGAVAPNPSELLNSRKFHALLEQLTQQADMVIMDSPPTLAAADAQILASQADGVVLVVEPGETKKVAAKQTLALLRHARANVLGVAYNKMKSPPHGSYYYYGSNTLPALDHMNGNGNGSGNGIATKAIPVAVEAENK